MDEVWAGEAGHHSAGNVVFEDFRNMTNSELNAYWQKVYSESVKARTRTSWAENALQEAQSEEGALDVEVDAIEELMYAREEEAEEEEQT